MNIQEIRAKYPQYSDMSDGDLASALHKKFYADMPFDSFAGKIGLQQEKTAPSQVIGEAQTNPEVNAPFGYKIQGETDAGFSPAAALIGAGRIADKLNQGYQQAKTAVNYAVQNAIPGMGNAATGSLDELMAQKEREAQKDAQFAKLEMVHPGSTQLGQVAPLLPLGPKAMIAAAATEYGSPKERLTRVGATVVGNKLATVAGRAVGGKVDDLAAAKIANAERDANVLAAREAGYKAIPSEVGGSMAGRTLEGLSGKIKTAQLTAVENQPLTAKLFRRAFKLSDDAPLTLETMKSVRAQAFEEGYAPVKAWGGERVRIKPDETLKADIKALTSRSDNAAEAFGDVVKSDISGLVEGLSSAKPFTASQGIDAIAILREKASEFYSKGEKSTGKAYKDAATALEGQIERVLTKSGKDGAVMLKSYREARKTMAQTFDGEKAINAGRDGMPDATALGKILKKSPDRLSGELRTIAQAAQSMPQATRLPQQGWSSPVTAVDSWGGTIGSAAAGNLLPFLAPAARVGARYGLLSKPGQAMFTKPNYNPGALLQAERALLENEFAPQAGGLLGYYFANR